MDFDPGATAATLGVELQVVRQDWLPTSGVAGELSKRDGHLAAEGKLLDPCRWVCRLVRNSGHLCRSVDSRPVAPAYLIEESHSWNDWTRLDQVVRRASEDRGRELAAPRIEDGLIRAVAVRCVFRVCRSINLQELDLSLVDERTSILGHLPADE